MAGQVSQQWGVRAQDLLGHVLYSELEHMVGPVFDHANDQDGRDARRSLVW